MLGLSPPFKGSSYQNKFEGLGRFFPTPYVGKNLIYISLLMSKIAEVKIHFWDKPRFYRVEGIEKLVKGDTVIVKTEHGLEAGEVLTVHKRSKGFTVEKEKISRKATQKDLEVITCHSAKEAEILEKARKRTRELKLPIKIIDVSFTVSGNKLIFAFIAEGRVDFRELVKRLSKDFQRLIRMQQIGSRDEAKESGGIGICGRSLCCASFLKNIESITTDMARTQQIIRQGNQRITGVCGRLMCCLAFEEEQYLELAKNMPGIGEEVKTREGRGEVVDRNILKQTVTVEIPKKDEKIKIEIPVLEL